MTRIRVSYTILSLWQKGQAEDALHNYFHTGTYTSSAMDAGNYWDDQITEEIQKAKRLPPEFGGALLRNPTSQLKIEIEYLDKFTLVGKLDALDEPDLYEFKTGSSKDSADYSQDIQVPYYMLLAERSGHTVDRAHIIHYDQAIRKMDRTLIWKTPTQIARAQNFIDTQANLFYDYLEKERLL